jgi:oligopeptidase B
MAILISAVIPGCSSDHKDEVSFEKKENQVKTPVPPRAEKIKKELILHGHKRIDNYYWLNQRENPRVIEYLTAENNYLKESMKHTLPLQEKLYNEIVGRIKQVDTSVPYRSNGYYYYRRYEKGKEYPVYCRKKGSMDAAEEILLDVNRMAVGHEYYRVARDFDVSSDNTKIAYGVDTVSRRKYTIHIKNLVSGEQLPDRIPNTDGRPVWANDNRTVFYVLKDHTLREFKVFSHRIGTPVQEDIEIYHEADETYNVSLEKSKSRKYIFINAYSTLSSEYRFLDPDRPEGVSQVIEPRQKGHEYSVEHCGDRWVIRTNYNAKNFRLMETPVDKLGKANWKEIIPHRDDVLLEEFEVFKDYLVLKERQKALEHLRVMEWDTRKEHYISFEVPTYSVWLSRRQEFDTSVLRYDFTSLAVPESAYEYGMKSKNKNRLKQQEVGGGFDAANYKTEWLWATATDGTKIPISLVYRKGLKKNGDNPLLLHGYGSYGYSMDVEFDVECLSLLDRGFIYALAHIRGGQEMGRRWYEEGKLLKKKNTFTDFIDCARFLVAGKFTNPGKLFASGASAGGLLMGAILNMRPDLFKGVIAGVPFVDAVTTMLDKSIPLTTSEFDEWGDPSRKDQYDYILSYSPYDNVEAKDYPAILVTTGLHDSQVQYWEPAKWVAKLRELKTDKNLLLLSTDMSAGHSGASGRFKRFKKTALEYAFILDLLGIEE